MTSKIFSVATFIVVSWLAVTVISTSNRVDALESTLLNGLTANASALDSRISSMEARQSVNHSNIVTQLEAIASAPAQTPAETSEQPTETSEQPTENSELQAETARLQQELAAQTKLAELKTAYRSVIESELEKKSNPQEAAEKLLSTKGPIWKASTQHASVKTNLQALMTPIDVLASKWKSGDTNGTVQPVFKVLKQTLATLDAE